MSQLDELLPDRVLEQLEAWTLWERRSWEPGTILCLSELSDALRWVPEGVLSASAVNWYRNSLQSRIGRDDGLRTGAIRAQLQDLLKKELTHHSQAHRRFDRLVEALKRHYLEAWRSAVASAPEKVNLERASRHIAMHVVDAGYDADWLRRDVLGRKRAGASALDLVDGLIELTQAQPRQIRGFVIVRSAPQLQALERADRWVDPSRLRAEMEPLGGLPPGLNYVGGLSFDVEALDPVSAAREVESILERIVARTRFFNPGSLFDYEPTFFTVRDGQVGLSGIRKGVKATSMRGALYASTLANASSRAIDDALLLAAPLLGTSDTASTAAGWASLESLLVTGADSRDREVGRAVAADRAALILTASWPRSELRRLSAAIKDEKSNDALVLRAIAGAGKANKRQSRVVMEFISEGRALSVKHPRDRAALLRMQMLLDNPRPVLRRVREYTTSSLRRLYRHRNVVLHGGEVRPVALRAALRTGAPLVAASLDRLSYAADVQKAGPLDAVSRAEVALGAIGDPTAWPLDELAN